MTDSLPTQARVVVIGGGIAGCSVAYHLATLGCREVVLLERDRLTSGTTWHAAGLVGQLKGTRATTEISRYAVELYLQLEAETGQATGFKQTGSLWLARTAERMVELRRGLSLATALGIEAGEIAPAEAGRLFPLIRTDDLVGAAFVPGDGQANPTDCAMALAKGARLAGARIFEQTRVTAVHRRDGRVSGVATDRGDVACEVVVNCAGIWARAVGAMAGVGVPLHAAEHMYIVTNPIPGLPSDLPSIRDPDGHIFLKEDAGKLATGGFEPEAKPWATHGIPDDFSFGLLNEDWDHFQIFMDSALHRCPAFETAEIRQFYNGPESFTPDGRYILGEAPELRSFFVLAGFNSIGIASAPGAGRALAEWILEGRPTQDLGELDIARFAPFEGGRRYLHDRTVEALGLLYGMHWPHRQPRTARGIRRSPLHDRLRAAGACFGVAAGWERPNWYAPAGAAAEYVYSHGRQNWFDVAAAEHRAVRQAVGLFDLSSLGKLLLQGRDAESVLQRLCASDMAVPPGRVVHTVMLNEQGGIEAEVIVIRLAETRLLVVTAAASTRRDAAWIERHIRDEARASIFDASAAYAVLGLMGPGARDLLQHLSDSDLSAAAFPYGTAREIDLGYARLWAARVSFVGELGWELYLPTEMAAHAYELLSEAGRCRGLRLAGYHALDSLRLEKGFASWGHDIGPFDTPSEAGLGATVAFDKPAPFLGRDALLRRRDRPLQRRLVSLTVDEPMDRPVAVAVQDEPVYIDGRLAGFTTSAAFGYTLDRSVALGWIRDPEGVDDAALTGRRVELDLAGRRLPAMLHLQAPYDPSGDRMTS